MKYNMQFLLFAAVSLLKMNSQVLINEGFTAPFNTALSGWYVQNLSSPTGTQTWQQGSPASYPAYDGAPADYFSANFNSQGGSPGGINNWLMTPTLTIYDGAVFQFATKTINGSPNIIPAADRLQLRMSTAGSASAIAAPTTTSSIGTFTDLLLDINPNLNLTNTSAVNNGSVNGYPNAWTVYSVQISGITGTVTGRFAFRYFVPNAGPAGANGNNVGIDLVKYTLPCGPVVSSFTSCAGTMAILNASGGLPATTYSWSTGSTSYSTVVSPTVTTPGAMQVYTLYPSVGGSISCGAPQTATITIGSQLSMDLSASTSTVCSGDPVTLSASAASSSYTWTDGSSILGSSQTITVAPLTTTSYSVSSLNGSCAGGNSITIHVNAPPVLTYSINPSPLCLGAQGITITTFGASTYTYLLAGNLTTTTNPFTNGAVPTTVGSYQFNIQGTDLNGCMSALTTCTFMVNPSPAVNLTSSQNSICLDQTVTLNASGADTYSWTGAASSANNSVTYTATTTGPKLFTVIGTNNAGCTASVVKTIYVNLCAGIGHVDPSSRLVVFPNPFKSEIHIENLNGIVKLYNALGQLLLATEVNAVSELKLTELPAGVYFLKVFDKEEQEIQSIKLLKN